MAAPTTGFDYGRCSPTPDQRTVPTTWRCGRHGGLVRDLDEGTCQTLEVLRDVRAERARQFAAYGTNENLEDGTGPDVQWLPNIHHEAVATEVALQFRHEYEHYKAEGDGLPTWRHLVTEEVAESFVETDPVRLREELIQVAALCVSWVEKIDARQGVAR